MIPVSDLYKEKMDEFTRPNSYIKITFSFENISAKTDAEIDYNNTTFSVTEGEFLTEQLFNEYIPTKSVATFERNRFTTTKNSVLRINDYENIDYLTSDEVSNNEGYFEINPIISVDFDNEQEVTSLQIAWDKLFNIVPEEIILHFGDNQFSYIGNNSTTQIIEEINSNSVKNMKIEIVKMSSGYSRARINSITFGVNKVFTNNDISSGGISYERSTDLISNEISLTELSFQLLNINDIYNPLNPEGSWTKLLKNQRIVLEFGRELNGEIYWLKTDTLYYDGLATVDGMFIDIKAQDILNVLTGSVGFPSTKNGVGYTAKELIQKLIEQVQENFPYQINVIYDDVLDQGDFIYGFDSLDIKEALQLIANANRCSLYSDENGNIVFKNATDPKITLSDNGHLIFSDLERAFNGITLPTKSYVQFLKEFYNTNSEKLIILPSQLTDEDKFGFISDKVSNDDCTFNDNPIIRVDYSLATSVFEIPIIFDNVLENYATEFNVNYYLKDELIETYFVVDNVDIGYTVFNNVMNTDRYEIEIIKWNVPNRRCVIDSISNGRVNDFYLSEEKLFSYPKLENLVNISSVKCFYYNDVVGEKKAFEMIEFVEEDKEGNLERRFKASHDPIVNKRLGNDIDDTKTIDANVGTVISTNVLFDASTLTVIGEEIKQEENFIETKFDNFGDVQEYKNPLIYGIENAKYMSSWLYDYILKGNKITLEYRGNPELQPLDIIYVDTKFEKKVLCRVISNTITMTGGMKGTLQVIKL
ncbi:MAG: hypothetical protein R3Y60_01900 [bacterium]